MAAKVLVFHEDSLRLFDTHQAVTRAAVGDPRGQAQRMTWHNRDALWQQDSGGRAVQAWAAAASAAQISAALQMVFELSLTHCNQRRQFGKSIGQFQAVQHQLSVMAQHVLASSLAAELAFSTSGTGPQTLHAAIAKARTSEAVALVCASAHALHGAIGITNEFVLGTYTRRLNEWRLDHGSESHWQGVIGTAVLAESGSVAGQLAAL
jgi:alkylation response protein AidB-like acyl-CoA dehydrogenase